MKKFAKFWKIIILDTLGVLLMILALATGWLPGPGGIPLFIIGLSLLAINHEWAQRYIDLLKEYADKFGDLIFIDKPVFKLLYDVLACIAIISGSSLLWIRNDFWMLPAGIFLFFIGLAIFLRNRHRYRNAKRALLNRKA